MPDGPGAPCANGLLRVVYWHRGGGSAAADHSRKYVYKENQTRDEASEESRKLDRSLNSSY